MWYNRPENLSNFVKKKRKIRAITAFKIIQGHRGRYQSKARMRFPISDWQPISYRFEVIAAYCSNFPPTRSLCRRGRPPPIIFAQIVRPMNALQICPWQFSHVLRLRRDERKYIENRRFHTNAVTLIPTFRYKGSPPTIIFARLVRPMNALQLCRWQFSHKETL